MSRTRRFLGGVAFGYANQALVTLVGLWLTGTALRSGERLLEQRLEQGVSETVSVVTVRWTQVRSALLSLAESPQVDAALSNPREAATQRRDESITA